jgi:predicted ATPase
VHRVVITGGPGAGKTSLLTTLASLGHPTVGDSARELIAERRFRGQSPRPEPLAFARELLSRDTAKYNSVLDRQGLVFFDRSALESLAMLHECEPLAPEDLARLSSQYSFYATVFWLPPWKAIYCTDAERDHDFEHSRWVASALARWYTELGYTINQVPLAPLGQRVSHVLSSLAASGA